MNPIRIASLDEIPENESRGYATDEPNHQSIFIVKRDGKVYAYKNHCPHTGVPLNWQPDIFMDIENFYIQCSIHGARFEVETGDCIWGPCVGQSLITLPILIKDNDIFLNPQDL